MNINESQNSLEEAGGGIDPRRRGNSVKTECPCSRNPHKIGIHVKKGTTSVWNYYKKPEMRRSCGGKKCTALSDPSQ